MKTSMIALVLIGLLSVALGVSAQDQNVADLAKQAAMEYLEENKQLTIDVASSLWSYAETALDEYQSYAKVTGVLKDADFQITHSVAEVPTAIMASWGSGKPVIGIFEDFDALVGVGHGCGHNLNTAAGVSAAIALKTVMNDYQIPGTIKLFIHPAEEVWDVAPLIASEGHYDDLDVLFSTHADSENTSEYGSTMAMDHVEYRFQGKAAHASAAPEMGRSALDAVELMNIAVNYLREHLIQEMRIHYVITDGGQAPNIVPETAAVRYYIRGPEYPDVAYARERIDEIAQAAALATRTEMSIGFSSGIYNKVPNKALAEVAIDALEFVGTQPFTAADVAEMEALGITGVPVADITHPTGSQSFGSNPIGDVSWQTPLTTINVATWVPGTAGHSEESSLQSGRVYGLQGAVKASKVLAVLGIELLSNPKALDQIQAEFADRMKGMPPYESKAFIPEVAYPEPPGVTIDAASGSAKFAVAQTTFIETVGDKLEITTMAGTPVGEHVFTAAPTAEYTFELTSKLEPGQRLKVAYYNGAEGYRWFYGYAHAQ